MHSKKVLTFSAIMLVTLLLFGACFAACGSTVETTITYYVDGEVYRTVTVTGTDMADPEITPSKTGFNFVGWYTDEALTEPFDFGAYAADADRQDISVYAKFEIVSSPVEPVVTETTITYIVDGAAWDSAIVDADTEQDPSKTPNKAGYAFVGWYTNESLTTPFNFADYIANRQRKDISVYAKWISAQDCFTYEENGSSYTITGLTEDGAYINKLSIPASYNGKPVTAIGSSAFYGCSSLASITIPDSVTSIGDSAFSGCSSLASITIPDNVTSIGSYAFSGCSSLTSITIPDSVTSIGNNAFDGCSSLTSITIPDSVTSIGNSAFQNCSSLTSVTIGNSVTSIGEYAFQYCNSLTDVHYQGDLQGWLSIYFGSADANPMCYAANLYINGELLEGEVVIPDGVQEIKDYAFYNVASITSVVIPDSVTSIGIYAFQYCSSLTSITLPFVGQYADGSGETHFGYIFGASTYENNNGYVPTSLKEVVITGGESIAESAFSNCGSLMSITIPGSVTSIGYRAFYSCSSLTIYCEAASQPSEWDSDWNSSDCPVVWDHNNNDVANDGYIYYVADNGIRLTLNPNTSVASVGEQPQSISGDIIIPESVTYKDVVYNVTSIGDSAFEYCRSLTSITIPNSVTSIGWWAFDGCSSLTSIVIPTSVTSIGSQAFQDCSSLENLSVAQGNPIYHSDGNCIIETESKTLIAGCKNSVIPDDGSVTSIGRYAFNYCRSLTSITIPDSVTNIGDYAFFGCVSLTSITIPDSVTSVGERVFEECNSLIETENGVSYVGRWVVDCDTNVTSLELRSNTVGIADSAFSHCSSLTSVTIPDSVTSIGEWAFWGCSSLTSIDIPGSVTSIADYTFSGCSSLASITIGGSMTSIGNSAFSDCSSLTSITIPDSVTSIGDSAFEYCRSLTSITIPNSVTSIGWWAFDGCSGLTSIVIPDSVTYIGEYAFDGCSSLTIYCEAAEQPNSWESNWNSSCSIVWNCNDKYIDHVDDSGLKYYLDTENLTASVTKQSTGISGDIVIPEAVICDGVIYAVTSIEGSAFSDCSGLTSITIPASVTSIGSSAFSYCSSLTSIVIPDSVTSIGNYAFRYCSGLTSVAIGEGVTSIGEGVFEGCNNLESMSIEQGNPVYHSGGNCIIETATKTLVLGCKNSVIPEDGSVKSIGSNAFYACSGLTSIVIPNSVTSIGGSAFEDCSSLTSITIPDSVLSIGSEAFANCAALESLSVAQGNPVYHSDGNCIINTATKTLIVGCKNSVIPDDGSVISIGSSAFSGCSSLTSITIPGSVTGIGGSAFDGCSSLTSITIPAGVTSIGYRVFYGCSNLTIYCEAATQPNGWNSNWNYSDCPVVWDYNNNEVADNGYIYHIADNGIRYALDLDTSVAIVVGQSQSISGDIVIPESVTYKDVAYSVTSIASYAFYYCSSLTSITIPDSVTSIGIYAFYGCSSLTSITLPFVGQYADGSGETHFGYIFGASYYYNNDEFVPASLTEVVITGGENIGRFAFSGCSSLTSMTIPDSVTSIGDSAFSGCSSLASITIPDNVTSIGSYAFSGCSSLTSITLPFIGENADGSGATNFGYIFGSVPTSLKEVVITGGESIGSYAFSGCSSLTSITIGGNVTSIGMWTFSGCSSLTSITIPDSVTNIGNYAFYNCSGLTSIVIPDSVTYIGECAFDGCNSLTIYCEAATQPSGWSSDWNSSNCPVVWNCNSNEIANDGYFYYVADNDIRYALDLDTSVAIVAEQSQSIGGDIVVPESVTYKDVAYSVTSIEGYAFSGCSSLTSITIPDNVTCIGDYAFNNCNSLTSITIGGSVTSIGGAAFYGCSSLTSINIPDSVTSIGGAAFSGCSGLTSINIPDSVTSIGGAAFYGCDSLTSITLPFVGQYADGSGETHFGYIFGASTYENNNSYVPTSLKEVVITGGKSINNYAFYGCSSLTSITIPNSVKSIGYNAFRGCSGLTNIIIPDSVTSIGDSAFYNCSSLTSVTIPDSVTSIGRYAFYGCSGLIETENGVNYVDRWVVDCETSVTSIELRDDTRGIADSAFSYCSNLTSIDIPDNVTIIGYAAFSGCSGLTSVVIPGSVTSIGSSAFEGCSSLTSITIGDSVTSIGNSAFKGCSGLTSIVIPDSVTSIDSSAFSGCSGLTSIVIGGSVTGIGEGAFEGCSGLTSVVIPGSVTSIGSSAFEGCSSLTSISIPGSVTRIGSAAFKGCSSLTSITLPFVGQYANGSGKTHFGYIFGAEDYSSNVSHVSASLTEVVITGGESIDDYAFYGCSSLTCVTVEDGITSIGSNAFEGCSNLTSITLPFAGQYADGSGETHFGYIFGAESYSYNDDYVPTSLNEVVITGGESIGSNAFYNCTGLTSITIGGSVTSIGDYAFQGCSSLTSITIGGSVTSIGRYAFSGCTSLTSITIGGSVTSIDDYAFSGCSSLTSVTIPDSVTSIDSFAFYGCNSLTSITLPFVGQYADGSGATNFGYIFGATDYSYNDNYVPTSLKEVVITGGESIDSYAFDGCSSLTSITIGGNVTSIGEYAFYNCNSLTSITIPDSVTSIGDSAFYGCRSLTSITIPDGVKSISYDTFYGCSSLTSITIPDSVTSIGYNAFYNCSSLTSITLPFVGQYADGSGKTHFGYIFGASTYENNNRYVPTSLKEVVITGGESIGEYAFYNCNSLTSITLPFVGQYADGSGETYFGYIFGASSYTYNDNYVPASLKEVVITGGESIGSYAFYGCSSLTSITIPDSVTSIGGYAFNGCSVMTIYCEAASQPSEWDSNWNPNNCPVVWNCNNNDVADDGYIYYVADNGIRYALNPNTLDAIIARQSQAISGDIVIPESVTYKDVAYSVTSIEGYAFSGCSRLTGIVISNGVTSIGEYSFHGCSRLTSITIPDSVTSIGDDAFSGCGSLTSVTIGDSVTSIGNSAFSGCSSLTSVTIGDGVKSIGYNAFRGCSGLTNIIIPDSVTSIGEYVFANCSRLTIYCEAASQPSGWNSRWNNSNRPVVWGYTGQ